MIVGMQYWMNTLVEWPAISSRLIPWLMSLNNVSGAFYWVDDVWAGGPNARDYMGQNASFLDNGQPGSARQGPGNWVHRLYANESCHNGIDASRPSCEWQMMTMKTDGVCSGYGAGSNGDGFFFYLRVRRLGKPDCREI